MKPDDPRHGTSRGYQTHLRHGETACLPCRRAGGQRAAEQRARELEDVALIDGAWVRSGPILVWREAVPS